MRTVRAHWHVTGHRNLPKITNVALIDGYSTEADIPKIIAIRYFDLDWAPRIVVTATEDVPAAPMPPTKIPTVMSGWCQYCTRYRRPCGRHED